MGLFSPVVWTRLFNHDKVYINKTVPLAIVKHTSSLAINSDKFTFHLLWSKELQPLYRQESFTENWNIHL